MTSRPWYAFYPADYQRDTAHLSMLEDGAYRRLMDQYYSTGNLLPTDVERLCRVCRVQTNDERDAVQFVLEEFFDLTEGGYRHDRIEKELEIARVFAERASKAGTASAAKRQLVSNLGSTSVALDGQPKTNRSQSQSQSQSQEEESSLRSDIPPSKKKSSEPPEGFQAFYQAYPRKVGVRAAEKAYGAAVARGAPETILTAASRYATATIGQDRHFIPHPATWLNRDGWLDEIEIHTNGNGHGNGKPPTAHDKFFAAALSLIRDDSGDTPGAGSPDDDVGASRNPLLPS